jgi:hypothetical protein
MKTVKLLLLAAIITLASCNKNQKVVNNLEGSWKVTAETIDGVSTPAADLPAATYTFENCKIKKGDCSGSISEDGKSTSFTYNISDKGTTMTITAFGVSGTSEILEHSSSKFVWKSTEDGETIETTIEKI